MGALGRLAIGFVARAGAPRGVSRVVERVSRHFGISLLTGFILLVVVPVAALLVAFTVIGIPLSIVAVLLYLATLYPGQIFPAMWLGEWIMRSLGRGGAPSSPYLAMTVGVILFAIVGGRLGYAGGAAGGLRGWGTLSSARATTSRRPPCARTPFSRWIKSRSQRGRWRRRAFCGGERTNRGGRGTLAW